MLKLLLDEHISPQAARGINRISKEVSVVPMVDWEQGRFLGVGAELILEQAARQALTLVTYDRKTIPSDFETVGGDWTASCRDYLCR